MSDDVEALLKAWTTAFTEEVLDYAQPPEVRDEEVSHVTVNTNDVYLP